MICGNNQLFQGHLEEAATWYRRARASWRARTERRVCSGSSTELLALAYAHDVTAVDAAAKVLTEVGEARTPHAAYVVLRR